MGELGRALAGGRASFIPPALLWRVVRAHAVEWAAKRRGVGWLCGYKKVAREWLTENLRQKNQLTAVSPMGLKRSGGEVFCCHTH